MKFVDSVKIHVRSGKGGSGCTSFRREKYIPMGGPDGGDGGKGGDIYFVGDQNRNTLLDLSFQQHQHAGNGSNGMGKDRHGKNGQDLKIHVPLGTMLKEQETGEILLEVLESEEYLLFKGGRGGRGNARFKTSTNCAPEHHQPGEEGMERWIQLELKLMADVGLLGFPNAGKSTFISSVSHARPKIADYPFTTLVPQLGVGDRFLKHVERTAMLLMLLDVSGFSEHEPLDEYRMLLHEIGEFSEELTKKPRIIGLTKIDSVQDRKTLDHVKKKLETLGEKVHLLSSVSQEGIPELVAELAMEVDSIRECETRSETNEETPS